MPMHAYLHGRIHGFLTLKSFDLLTTFILHSQRYLRYLNTVHTNWLAIFLYIGSLCYLSATAINMRHGRRRATRRGESWVSWLAQWLEWNRAPFAWTVASFLLIQVLFAQTPIIFPRWVVHRGGKETGQWQVFPVLFHPWRERSWSWTVFWSLHGLLVSFSTAYISCFRFLVPSCSCSRSISNQPLKIQNFMYVSFQTPIAQVNHMFRFGRK